MRFCGKSNDTYIFIYARRDNGFGISCLENDYLKSYFRGNCINLSIVSSRRFEFKYYLI